MSFVTRSKSRSKSRPPLEAEKSEEKRIHADEETKLPLEKKGDVGETSNPWTLEQEIKGTEFENDLKDDPELFGETSNNDVLRTTQNEANVFKQKEMAVSALQELKDKGTGSRRVSFSNEDDIVPNTPFHDSPSMSLTPAVRSAVPRQKMRSLSRDDRYPHKAYTEESRKHEDSDQSEHSRESSSESEHEYDRRNARRKSNSRKRVSEVTAAAAAAAATAAASALAAQAAKERRRSKQRNYDSESESEQEYDSDFDAEDLRASRVSKSKSRDDTSRSKQQQKTKRISRLEQNLNVQNDSIPKSANREQPKPRVEDYHDWSPNSAYELNGDEEFLEHTDNDRNQHHFRQPPPLNAFAAPAPIPPPPHVVHQLHNYRPKPNRDDPFGSGSEDDGDDSKRPTKDTENGEPYETDDDTQQPVKTGPIYEKVKPDSIELPPSKTCSETLARCLDASSTYLFRYLITLALPIIFSVFLVSEWSSALSIYNENFSQKVTLGTLERTLVCPVSDSEMKYGFKSVGTIGDIRDTTLIVASVFAGLSVFLRLWERSSGRNHYGWHLRFELITQPLIAASFMYSLIMPFISKEILQKYGSPSSDCAPNSTLSKTRELNSKMKSASIPAFIAAFYGLVAVALVFRQLLQKWHLLEYHGQPLQYRVMVSKDGVTIPPEERVYQQPGLKSKNRSSKQQSGTQKQSNAHSNKKSSNKKSSVQYGNNNV